MAPYTRLPNSYYEHPQLSGGGCYQFPQQRCLPGAFGYTVPRSTSPSLREQLNALRQRQAQRQAETDGLMRRLRQIQQRPTVRAEDYMKPGPVHVVPAYKMAPHWERGGILATRCHKYSRERLNRLKSLGGGK